MTSTFRTNSEVETIQRARALGTRILPHAIVLLFGDLGSGKTSFVRGLVAAAGGHPDEVTSPTFTLIQEYAGTHAVYHVDLYRVQSVEIDELGLGELTAGPGIVAIEWADKLPRPFVGAIEVHIEDKGGDAREIRVEEPDGIREGRGQETATRSGSSEPPW